MKVLPHLILSVLCDVLASCASYTELGYKDFKRDLGNDHELTISTYPAGMPKVVPHRSHVQSATRSHDQVYFQIQVGDVEAVQTPNRNHVTIHSFAYIIANRSWIPLIKHYEGSFWMQGNPNYDKGDSQPIPYLEKGVVRFRIDFTLNGKRYQIEDEMPVSRKTTTYPLFLHNKGI